METGEVAKTLQDALKRCASYFTVMHALAIFELEGEELTLGDDDFEPMSWDEPDEHYPKTLTNSSSPQNDELMFLLRRFFWEHVM